MDKPRKARKIEFADSTQASRHAAGMGRLIRLIGEVIGEDWKLSNVFVSDQSSVGHFVTDDTDLRTLSQRLGFSVAHSDLLVDVVLRMPPAN